MQVMAKDLVINVMGSHLDSPNCCLSAGGVFRPLFVAWG
ncbi:hypothetical protein Rifp1Sym_ac00400 [endosymbiont of Riftia pachyptila (vent Ph05)]|uniref:Uncharacterized protein n=1 Tax=endosymbiont of Riftia pachyptila (vent Ph05) TaxID=1048808 RepID=G2D9G9_9GAMM|nr:hypothetical protein Rifp1Sym_ac00400 [endosymbiont of Riftia pachyptila (vent Ph05)]